MMAMVANQLNDRVLFFEVNPRASNESLKLVCRSTGGNHAAWGRMSHSRDHFAATTYRENSVVISHKNSIGVGALSRDDHLNSNVASSFSVFSICSIMVDLNHTA
ncbi:hypothetical protein QTG54_012930 [Skeletonema marinoi]|uniref:Uncharacterized protein n=1 Tax=Skeletonema marinoi TaxID=267567 RepID=A0AAD8XZJ6_9STRA|nr:hypothetical protein QTG54_012930 [Skeletonema marinoi]